MIQFAESPQISTWRSILVVDSNALTSSAIGLFVDYVYHAATHVIRHSTEIEHVDLSQLSYAFLEPLLDDGNTFELARRLKRNQTPFAFLSMSERLELPDDLYDCPFVEKPCSEERMIAILNRYL